MGFCFGDLYAGLLNEVGVNPLLNKLYKFGESAVIKLGRFSIFLASLSIGCANLRNYPGVILYFELP